MEESKRKDIEEQWKLARMFAKSVLREKKMRQLKAPIVLRQVEIEIGNGRKRKLNNTGRYLISYALKYEKAITKKDRIIQNSLFGVLFEAINDLDAFYKDIQKEDLVIDPFEYPEINLFWKKFREGMESNNKNVAMEALLEILRFVFGDLLWTNFPNLSNSPLEDILGE